MRARDRLVAQAVLLALILLLSATSPGLAPSTPGFRASAAPAPLAAHPPILIDGDAGFNATNGVVGGTGTPLDPFVIAGWDITPLGADGVELHNTTAYAVLRDVIIRGQDPAYVDVFLWQASNVTVENVTATGSAQGIYLWQASHVTVRGCSAPFHDGGSVTVGSSDHVVVDGNDGGYSSWGVAVRQSSNVTVTNNRIANVTLGVDIEGSEGVAVSGNRVDNGSAYGSPLAGIYVAASGGTAITGNVVTGMVGSGIRVENSTWVTMTGNNLTQNGVGAALLTSTGLITHNRFLFNNVSSVSDLGNVWDAGYPTGGNYWSDYDGVDRCRGPAQTDCTGPDGIGDTPYLVNGAVRDRYPLIITDLPPFPRILASATDVLVGRTVSFRTAVAIHGGTVVSTTWSFGDGALAQGESVAHAYVAAGAYTVSVKVQDNRSRFGNASARVTVWPAVAFVTVSHSSGFRLSVPADWETHTDYSAGGQTAPVLSLGPTADAFRTNVLVEYVADSSALEDPAYLASVVNGTIQEVRQSSADAYLQGGLVYLTVSGHAAVGFTIGYSSHSYVQRAVIVVSSAHGRDWLILLSSGASVYARMNATFEAIVSSFTITALPTLAVVALVGGLIGAVVIGVVYVVLRVRKKRASRPRAAPPSPPYAGPAVEAPAFCVQCGARLEVGMPFCGKCGTRVGGGQPPAG